MEEEFSFTVFYGACYFRMQTLFGHGWPRLEIQLEPTKAWPVAKIHVYPFDSIFNGLLTAGQSQAGARYP